MKLCKRTWFGRGITLEEAAHIRDRKSVWMVEYLRSRTERYRPGGRKDSLHSFYRTSHLAKMRERKG